MSHNKERVGPRITSALQGLRSHLPKGVKSLKVGDKVYTVSALEKLLGELETKFTVAEDAHAALTARIRERDEVVPAALELMADFKAAMIHLLGRKNELLLKFGLKPQKDARRSRAGKGEEKPVTEAKPGA